jgi:rod shape determining protein RodA
MVLMSKNEQEYSSPLQKLDYNLLFLLFLFICVSCLAIYSAQIIGQYENENFVLKQLIWYFLGSMAVIVTMILDFDQYRKLSWYLYGFGIILLLGIVIIPMVNPNSELVPYINGARSWYSIKFMSFQPSEVMKVALIIALSHTISKHNETYITRTVREDFILLGKISIISLFPLLLVLKQPDLGTSLVFIAIIGSLILVSGIRWRIIFSLLVAFVLFISTLIFVYFKFPKFFLEHILESYQLERFYGWLAPYEYEKEGFHLVKSLKAIGSGQLYGKGFTEGSVYIPEAQTDFIFAIVGEEFGFLGTSIVIALFFLLIYRIIHIALETHDPFGSYLCAGVTGMITFQVFQNVGMGIGILPITGIPLPFISYGGSSILASLIALGLILNVSSRSRKFMFD